MGKWDIFRIHDLYLKAMERSKERQNRVYDALCMIEREIEPFDDRKDRRMWRVYYEPSYASGIFHYYIVKEIKKGQYRYERGSHSVSKEDVVERRDCVIDTLIESETEYLGNVLHQAVRNLSYFHEDVFRHIEDNAVYSLTSRYYDYRKEEVPDSILIDIAGHHYVARRKDSSYLDFEITKIPDNEPIKIYF